MNPREVVYSVSILCALALAGGCVSKPKSHATTAPIGIDRQTLDQIEPALILPAPTTRRSMPAPPMALQLYAQGRDALLENRKKDAIEKLTAAIELDQSSGVMFRDLGYAWLGTDSDRAASAYRQAVEVDPDDADSRVQLARLLLIRNDPAGATEQLRLARLSKIYDSSDVSAAVVDLLLGRVLAERGYTRAAIECLEKVLPIVDRGSLELRARPELVELVAKPAVLKLRIADLSARVGDYDRAIELYEQIRADEPTAAGGIELRIIQTLANKGELDRAASQMLDLVERYKAGRSSLNAYIDLFADHGGDEAALAQIQKRAGADRSSSIGVLRARLLRRLGRPREAIDAFVEGPLTMPIVRERLLALQDAGLRQDAPRILSGWMMEQPKEYRAIARGWAMLTQTMQASPLRVADVQALKLPAEWESARLYTVAQLAAESGQPVLARSTLAKAAQLDAARVRLWSEALTSEPPPDVDYTSERDVQRFAEEFGNDPVYLSVAIQFMARQGQAAKLIPSLQVMVERSPGNVPVLTQLVTLLQASDRQPEAMKLIERAGETVKSANELYHVSALLTRMGESAAAERLLRRANQVDPQHPPTCNDLGYVLADAGRDLDFAEELLWRAVGLEPENPAYVDSLGWLLYKRGKFDQAQQYLEQALAASDPPDPVVLDHAADASYRTNKPDKAKQYWQQAIERIKQQGASEPQLRLKIEQKLRQITSGQNVDVAAGGS